MQGAATVMGHPIHPIFVVFPIAFFIGSLVCDIICRYRRDDFWRRAALLLIGFGLIGGLIAAVFGFIDYFTLPLDGEEREDATIHMIANLVVMGLFTANFFLRRRNPDARLGYALSVIGVLGLIYAGFIGGEMVYQDHLGVAPHEGRQLLLGSTIADFTGCFAFLAALMSRYRTVSQRAL